ncbi:MAG: GDYXXLXY domain-containing protein [Desulfobulbaceae bacterium]|jgi:uncharacterized membrane-anchored protein|nr:GDYXXLXY domain-containing protein [Desulfobulbaceae bacterium]
MTKINVRLALFALFAIASVAVPLSIVWKYENTLRHGTLYKFRTKPVDPSDAFRGRYVTLTFDNDLIERIQREGNGGELKQEELPYNPGRLLYVRIAADAEGFAKPALASLTPLTGNDVITVDDWWKLYATDATKGWTLNYPFNRYYLPEDMAPKAEELYREANRRQNDGQQSARETSSYVTVRVGNGVGVIEELYINGKPVREAVTAELGKK